MIKSYWVQLILADSIEKHEDLTVIELEQFILESEQRSDVKAINYGKKHLIAL